MDWITLILKVTMAIVPPILFMVITYKIDWKEREPISLLLILALLGAIAFLAAYLWEMAGDCFLNRFIENESLRVALQMMIVVGFGEELLKFGMLYLGTWNNKEFNYRFDGIVYAVYVSLGFALVENLSYVIGNSLHTAFIRAISSIPLHASCGVIMGIYYGFARGCANMENARGMKRKMWFSVIVASLVHGFYDYTMLLKTNLMSIIWMVFTISLFGIVIYRLSEQCAMDHDITGDGVEEEDVFQRIHQYEDIE